jgi:hypothetical protein
MHKVYNFVRNGLKYTTVVLALILLIGQVSTILNEVVGGNEENHSGTDRLGIKDEDFDKEIFFLMTTNIQRNNYRKIFTFREENISKIGKKSGPSLSIYQDCHENSNVLLKMLNLIFKCSLAFLAGGLLSDMKFIKFGVF